MVQKLVPDLQLNLTIMHFNLNSKQISVERISLKTACIVILLKASF